MVFCDGNGKIKRHRHQWTTMKVSSNGSLTQKCECKSVPDCPAMRQMSPDGYCIYLRESASL